jgi:hypothetical protein
LLKNLLSFGLGVILIIFRFQLKLFLCKYPPAEPEALRCEPLKAASMRRLALSRFLSLLLHLFFP